MILGAGCTPVPQKETTIKTQKIEQSDLKTPRIELLKEKLFKPGNIHLAFKVLGENGQELKPDDLKIQHEQKIHLILVRDDMTGFQHLHPEFRDGIWHVPTTFKDQGIYNMYVDIAPVQEDPLVLHLPLKINGDTKNPQIPEPSKDLTVQNGAYEAKLTIDQPIQSKQEKTWTFILTKNGKSVVHVEPYLGAYGHVVELQHGNPKDFFHVHPITQEQPKDGKIQFLGSFPNKGRYTIYAQFNIENEIQTFPITIDIQDEGQTEDSMHGAH